MSEENARRRTACPKPCGFPFVKRPAQPSLHPWVILSGLGRCSYSFELSKGQFPKWVTANSQKHPIPDQRGLNSVRRARELGIKHRSPSTCSPKGFLSHQVGVTRFELATSWSRTKR